MKRESVKCDLCDTEVPIETSGLWSRWAVGQIHGNEHKAQSHYLLDICPRCWHTQPLRTARGALAIFFRKLRGKAA